MIRTTDPVYDAAIAEVREKATQEQVDLLESDYAHWVEALELCLDEVDSQFPIKQQQFDDDAEYMDDEQYDDALEELKAWKAKSRTFRKHIDVRLRSLIRKIEKSAPVDLPWAVGSLYEAENAEEYDPAETQRAIMVLLEIYERDHL